MVEQLLRKEKPIRFGIPSLDVLLGRRAPQVYQFDVAQPDNLENPCGIDVSARDQSKREALAISVIGSDGTGKSILAMHLAARYMADRIGSEVPQKEIDTTFRVIYASTDLSMSRATAIWENFELELPESRIDNPFEFSKREERANKNRGPANLGIHVSLSPMRPFDDGAGLLQPAATSKLHFLDLASCTSGDDWGYLNRLIASLPGISDGPCHLLVVDTVDDLELMAGDRDAHGVRRDRRSRIAELIRTATGKCHLLLLSGDQPKGQAPEEYISDVVLRLGFRIQDEYQQRVVSVEKVRGQSSIRGDHDLTIRSGIGGSTGQQEHFDDPRIVRQLAHKDPSLQEPLKVVNSAVRRDRKQKQQQAIALEPRDTADMRAGNLTKFQAPFAGQFQSYVYVFHSLHYLNNSIMRADGPSVRIRKDDQRYARFGITHLDDMLDFTPSTMNSPRQVFGIPTHEPAALIGEDGTHKSALSKAFLSRALLPEQEAVDFKSGQQRESDAPHGVAILLTTKTLDTESLLTRLNDHLPKDRKCPSDDETNDIYKRYRARVICRRFDYHHMTSAVLFHIVAQAVRAAQRIVATSESMSTEIVELIRSNPKMHSEEIRRSYGWRIRLVIDNWSALREMYPDVRKDSLFLPCLLFYLRREGIATLIVGNEDRGFSDGFELKHCRSLRDLTSIHLFTWHTPFFGQNRVAITLNPPVGRERIDAIRELSLLNSDRHVPTNDDHKISVNTSFEMYDGIQQRSPKYVPVRLHLYGGGDRDEAYFADIKALFGQLVHGDTKADVVRIERVESYELLREFSHLQGPSRFPYTLVLQVDEFWAKTGVLHLRRMDRYLKAKVAFSKKQTDGVTSETRNLVVEDPFDLFQPTERQTAEVMKVHDEKEWLRADFLTPPGYNLRKHISRPDRKGTVVKVPYAWDFGFLMCHSHLWDLAAKHSKGQASRLWLDVHTGLYRLKEASKGPTRTNVTWDAFVKACHEVADHANVQCKEGHRYIPFALAPEAQESLSCILLEIWASEVEMGVRKKGGGSDEGMTFERNRHESETLDDLGAFAQTFKVQLYKALCLLYELIPQDTIGADNQLTSSRGRNTIPVAVRSWYSTAAEYQSSASDDWYVPARLPGQYSTRGDWFLAVARGSRSYQMGERAIDLLSTRRANIIRLQAGIGLPIRDNDSDRTGLWTSLLAGDQKAGAITRITYKDLVQLGGPANPVDENGMPRGDFRGGTLKWLWRSRINHYDRHARVFRRWICWILRGEFRKEADKKTGLDLYRNEIIANNLENEKWWFHSAVAKLQETLRDATIQSMSTD